MPRGCSEPQSHILPQWSLHGDPWDLGFTIKSVAKPAEVNEWFVLVPADTFISRISFVPTELQGLILS